MSTWRTTRQIEYVIGFLLCIGVFIVVPILYFTNDAPTCVDGIQNQNELGIDCGGVCVRACEFEVAEPQVRWQRIFKIRDRQYHAVAYIENSNLKYKAENVPYILKIYDASQNVIAERKGRVNIPEGTKVAVFEPHFILETEPARVTFEFQEKIVWKKTKGKAETITAVNPILTNADTIPRVDAQIINSNLAAEKNIEVVALVYDGKKNAVGVSSTEIKELKGKEVKNIFFTWPEPFTIAENICKSPVDVSIVIDRSGSMAKDGTNPPQPLTDVKNAAKSFVAMLDNENDRISVVSFAGTASDPVDLSLTQDHSGVLDALSNVSIATSTLQQTNIADGLKQSWKTLTVTESPYQKVIVILTDGIPTLPLGPTRNNPSIAALTEANFIKEQGGKIFTIGLGKDLDQTLLKSISSTPEDFFLAPQAKDLTNIYRSIATTICKDSPVVVELIPVIK